MNVLSLDYFENTVPANVNNSVTVEVIASIPTDAALGANFEFSVDAYLNDIGSTSEIRTVNVGSPTYSTTVRIKRHAVACDNVFFYKGILFYFILSIYKLRLKQICIFTYMLL